MRRIDCQTIRREVETSAPGDLLSSNAHDHLKICKACGTFREEEWKLRTLVASLGTVNAPGDFDYRLRARLAAEKHGSSQSIAVGKFSFGFRSAVFATALLLIGAGFLFVGLRTNSNKSQVARESAPPNNVARNATLELTASPQVTQPVAVKLSSTDSPAPHRNPSRAVTKSAQLASARNAVRLHSRDFASTPATLVKSTNSEAEPLGPNAFSIGASYQSLKVSIDDGRGSSRTISLPSVSFGSQRVLRQGATPVLASARGSW